MAGNLWSQLAYQFSHELGHVIGNSWTTAARSYHGVSHWLEEGLVEAFAIDRLRSLASLWRSDPPYPNWQPYADHLQYYGNKRLDKMRAHPQTMAFEANGPAWFAANETILARADTIVQDIWPIVPWLVERFESDPSLILDIAALNRWDERARLAVPDYLERLDPSLTRSWFARGWVR